jgi:hypothetical protein
VRASRGLGLATLIGSLAIPAAATASPVKPRAHGPAAHVSVAPARIAARTYYVSPSGSDSSSGTSPAHAWRTVHRVNLARLAPGDGVLFQSGRTFSDDALMPAGSGALGAPIVFGSYGRGQATITRGVWFVDADRLTFDRLALGPMAGLQGGNDGGRRADDIRVQRCTISLTAGNPAPAINATGDNWTIAGNTVANVGNSGMLLTGDSYTIIGNTIDRTGLDRALDYGKHGIYLKVAHATVTHNTITRFASDGISARYRDSTISHNSISNGPIGIAFFQYDDVAGTSHWSENQISGTTAAGIYVSASDQAGPTIESFMITDNSIRAASGQTINVKHTSGTSLVRGNRRR